FARRQAGGESAAEPAAMRDVASGFSRTVTVRLKADTTYRGWALVLPVVALASTYAAAQKPAPSPPGRPWFEEVADKSGIRFTHRSGHRDKFYLPEIMGGGAALFDM